MKMMKRLRLAGLIVGSGLLLAGLSGCGKDTPPAKPPINPFAGLPFVLVPGPGGNLEPRTADDKPIAPADTPPTDAIKAIANLSQVSVLKIDGSCYYLIYSNGRWYKVPC